MNSYATTRLSSKAKSSFPEEVRFELGLSEGDLRGHGSRRCCDAQGHHATQA